MNGRTLDSPNRARLIETARRLESLLPDVVFVGGHLVDLLVTDPAAYRTRPTDDVDIVVPCTSRLQYQKLRDRIHELGFGPDTRAGAPLCRTRTSDGYVLDVMPLDESILDFTNRWYSLVLDSAQQLSVTPAITIRIANAPVFLLTKWDAFGHRGADDPYGSHDLEDIVMLVAGRPELSHEVLELPLDARRFLVNALRDALGSEWFLDVVEGALPDARTLPGLVGLVHGRFTTMLTQLTMKDDTQ